MAASVKNQSMNIDALALQLEVALGTLANAIEGAAKRIALSSEGAKSEQKDFEKGFLKEFADKAFKAVNAGVDQSADLQRRARAFNTSASALSALGVIAADANMSEAKLDAVLASWREAIETQPNVQAALAKHVKLLDDSGKQRDTIAVLADLAPLLKTMTSQDRRALTDSLGLDAEMGRLLGQRDFDVEFARRRQNAAALDGQAASAEKFVRARRDVALASNYGVAAATENALGILGDAMGDLANSAARALPQLGKSLSKLVAAPAVVAAGGISATAKGLDGLSFADTETDGWSTVIGAPAAIATGALASSAAGRRVLRGAAAGGWQLGKAGVSGLARAGKTAWRWPASRAAGVAGLGLEVVAQFRDYMHSEDGARMVIKDTNARLAEFRGAVQAEHPDNAVGINLARTRAQAYLGGRQLAYEKLNQMLIAEGRAPEQPDDLFADLVIPEPVADLVIPRAGLGGWFGGPGNALGPLEPETVRVGTGTYMPGIDYSAFISASLAANEPRSVWVESTNNIHVSGVAEPQAVANAIGAEVQHATQAGLNRALQGGQP